MGCMTGRHARCCGTGYTVGYDQDSWPRQLGCWPEGTTIIENVASEISAIYDCDLVFAGNNGECYNGPGVDSGKAIRFDESDWPTILDYIEGGGRLFINSEFALCLEDPDVLAEFLTAMGSELVWAGELHQGSSCVQWAIGDANIMQGLPATDRRGIATARISGGTSVFLTTSSTVVPCVAVEQIGSGFLFLSGDSNNWGPPSTVCIYPNPVNCGYALRLLTTADEDVE